MVEQFFDAGNGHVRRWETGQYMPVQGIVPLARKHCRDARNPDGFHGGENSQFVVDQDVPAHGSNNLDRSTFLG